MMGMHCILVAPRQPQSGSDRETAQMLLWSHTFRSKDPSDSWYIKALPLPVQVHSSDASLPAAADCVGPSMPELLGPGAPHMVCTSCC
jgi:hypothetical protein